jgi:hypothetical protein
MAICHLAIRLPDVKRLGREWLSPPKQGRPDGREQTGWRGHTLAKVSGGTFPARSRWPGPDGERGIYFSALDFLSFFCRLEAFLEKSGPDLR